MATLKEQALLQRIGEISIQDAEAIANLRVQLTDALNELEELKAAVKELTPSETENVQK